MRRLGGALAAVAIVLTGCGNAVSTQIVGTTGMTVDHAGKPVGLVAVCDGSVDQLTISGDRTGLKEDQPNKDIGMWKASAPDAAGIVTVDLGEDAPVLEEGRTYIAIADRSDADAEATQVTFSLADLAALAPGHVLVRDAEVQTRADFEASCD